MKNWLRLASGLILFTFVASHLVNHAFGMVSVHAMAQASTVLLWFWRTSAGIFLLALAALVHACVALHTVYVRRTLRMPVWEWLQMGLGLVIPVLLIEHVLGTLVSELTFGSDPDYDLVVAYHWVVSPVNAALQSLLLLVAWSHGCIGLHFWLRIKPIYQPLKPYALSLAVAIACLSLAGYVAAGFEVRRLAADQPTFVETRFATAHVDTEVRTFVQTGTTVGQIGFVGLVLIVLGARAVRDMSRQWRRLPRVTLLNHSGALIVRPGATLLETLRLGDIPIASVCGGRARCSTCRIRIVSADGALPLPDALEGTVLGRIGAPADVRLACQLRPTTDVEVAPLLPPTVSADSALRAPHYLHGDEREIAILFADLRGFTRLASQRLPYDVVYVLNQYFAVCGRAIEVTGGYLDKFIGDGVMALFGIESGPAEGSRGALQAAARISDGLAGINRSLKMDLPEPLRIGLGIHVGTVILGEIGYGKTKSITAIGDAVNTASRLEGLSKQFAAELVVSDETVQYSGLDLSAYPLQETSIRGKDGVIRVRVIARAASLPVPEMRLERRNGRR